jgi:exopolyphosphatase/guanosine-5'-triphosphate,3'-diphosphate pyrophosphatase
LKISVIDVGFNSVKLVNYNVISDDCFKSYEEHSVKARLGEGLSDTGSLTKYSISRTIEALKFFREIIHMRSIKYILPIATSAVREANNREDFLAQVYKETGFEFKVLSAEDEALYSYLGASRATCHRNVLFFDLGGGSLELVYARDYKVKKIISLPLGALRLSEKYSKEDGTFSKKNFIKLETAILECLPSPKFLNLSKGTELVGVGGSLRAIARYDQKMRKYPIDKLHNYLMNHGSLESIRKKLSKLTLTEISNIDVIGNNRAFTITAGSYVINSLMKKLGFRKLTVSTHGLREGFLSQYLFDPTTIRLEKLERKIIQNSVKDKCELDFLPNNTSRFTKKLVSLGLLKKQEFEVFVCAKKKLSNRSYDLTEPQTIFNNIMNETFPRIGHRDQIVLALSIIFRKKPKVVDKFFKQYDSIIKPEDFKSVQKVAVCINLTEIFERYKARVDVGRDRFKTILMNIAATGNSFPDLFLRNNLKLFESAFEVRLSYVVLRDEKETDEASKKLTYNLLP